MSKSAAGFQIVLACWPLALSSAIERPIQRQETDNEHLLFRSHSNMINVSPSIMQLPYVSLRARTNLPALHRTCYRIVLMSLCRFI